MSKIFSARQIRLNVADMINQATDPSSGPGTAAAIGSMVLQGGAVGGLWIKTGVADTDWEKLAQSLAWYVVKDFGAKGNGVSDDTVAVQAAVDACDAAGGGVVFFPSGVYPVTQIALTGTTGVQVRGAGSSSVIRWVMNAGGAPGAMITVSQGATNTILSSIRLDGSGLINPSAGGDNHLLLVGDGTAATTTRITQCYLGGMVPGSGDGIHVSGGVGAPVSRIWIVENNLEGCARFGVGFQQGVEYAWISDNFLSDCQTEVALIASSAIPTNAINVSGNRITHAGADQRALRVEGDPAMPYSRVVISENVILGGFCAISDVTWATITGNITTSGPYASGDGVWKFSGASSFVAFSSGNVIDRDPGASPGPCLSIEGGASAPSMCRFGQALMINEASGEFVSIVDATKISVGDCVCHSTSAGASTSFGFDVRAQATIMTDVMIGPGNQMTTLAGSLAACVRLLANGADVSDVSVVGNQADACDFGLRREVDGGGAFTGQVLYSGNNFDSSIGDVSDVGTSAPLHIGFNAATQGANLFQGSGSPEGVVTARVGSQYMRTDGGSAETLYYKESGAGNSGWIGVGGAPIIFGADDLDVASAARFFAPGYIGIASSTELQFAITRPGKIRNLRVRVASAGTDPATVTFTTRLNGVDQALSCSIQNDTGGDASDLINSFSVVAGSLLSIRITKSGIVTAGQGGVTATVELV